MILIDPADPVGSSFALAEVANRSRTAYFTPKILELFRLSALLETGFAESVH
jgi:hypothetical protein